MNETEQLRQEVAGIAEQLIAQIVQLQHAQAAQKAGWLLLLAQLSRQGLLDLPRLRSDLATQAELIDDAGLQSQYAEFADAVRFLADLTAEKR